MKEIKKFKIKSFKSFSGKLVPVTFDKKFPFLIKRIFFLHGIKNKTRGDHAHKKCSQLFLLVSGIGTTFIFFLKLLIYFLLMLLNLKLKSSNFEHTKCRI